MEIRVVACTLMVDILDGILVNVDITFVGVHVLRPDIARIETDSYGDRFKYASWLIE